jgi:uncharacterized membrane protein
MSTAITIHLAAAGIALALGIAVLAAAKGTARHRLIGRCWVAAMAGVVLSSLWIPSFLAIGWIHVFTLIVAVNVPAAILAIRRGKVVAHRQAMIGSLLGLLGAGLGALLPGRLLGSAVARLLGSG